MITEFSKRDAIISIMQNAQKFAEDDLSENDGEIRGRTASVQTFIAVYNVHSQRANQTFREIKIDKTFQ